MLVADRHAKLHGSFNYTGGEAGTLFQEPGLNGESSSVCSVPM